MGQNSVILVNLYYLQLSLLPPLQADLGACTAPPNTEGRRDELRENNVDETLLGMQMNKLVKCEKNTRKHPCAILQALILWGFSCGRSVCVSAGKKTPPQRQGVFLQRWNINRNTALTLNGLFSIDQLEAWVRRWVLFMATLTCRQCIPIYTKKSERRLRVRMSGDFR